MSYNNITKSLPAGTGGVKKGRFCKLSTGTLVHCSAIADVAFGVALNDAAENELVAVAVAGEVDVECAAALTLGGPIMSNADGRAANAAGATAIIQAKALEVGAAAVSSTYAYARICLIDPKLAVGP